MGCIDRIVKLLISSCNSDPEIRVSYIRQEVECFLEMSEGFDGLPDGEVTMGLSIKIN